MCQGGACGDLERPPSRSNMSLWAIIELVCMGVCTVMCAVNLSTIINNKGNRSLDTWEIIQIVIDGLIVIGMVLILVGLFCSPNASTIRSGILCFVVGAITSVVVTIYQAVDSGYVNFYTICYIVFLVFLAYILWVQSSHL